MSIIFAGMFALLALLIVLKVLRDDAKGEVPLASARNIYLAGFTMFQVTSSIYVSLGYFRMGFHISEPVATQLKFALYIVLFLVTFFIGYKFVRPARLLRSKVRSSFTHEGATTVQLILLALTLTVIGFVFKYAVNVPYIGALTGYTGIGLAGIAAGIGGWLWAPKIFNPTFIFIAGFFLLANLVTSTITGYGRRDELAIFICFAWGMFHSHFRYKKLMTYFPIIAALGLTTLLAIGALSSVRREAEEVSFARRIQLYLFESDPVEPTIELLEGQNAGQISMWLTEVYPERFDYHYFRTFKYFFTFPIPRAIWEGKPDTLSGELAVKAGLRGVDRTQGAREGLNIGPGIVGTAHADGGLPMILFYGFVIGAGLRLADQFLIETPRRMFLVLPISAAAGDLIASPRGAVAPMTFQYAWSVSSCIAVMAVLPRLLRFPRKIDTGEPEPLRKEHMRKAANEPTPQTAPAPTTPDAPHRPHDDNWAAMPTA